MKITFNKTFWINLVIILDILYYVGDTKLGFKYVNQHYWSKDRKFRPIDPVIPDTLPYREFVRRSDSIKQNRKFKNGINQGGTYFQGLIGYTKVRFCDTCTSELFKYDKKQGNTINAFQLTGWILKPCLDPEEGDTVIYHREKEQSYLREDNWLASYVDKPVDFLYNEEANAIMIPVKGNYQELIKIVFISLAIIWSIGNLLVTIEFIVITFNILRGQSFTENNLKRIKLAGFALFFFPFVKLLAHLVIWLIFHKSFTNEVVLNKEIWLPSNTYFVASFFFLLIYKAFSQGKKLKEETELTI